MEYRRILLGLVVYFAATLTMASGPEQLMDPCLTSEEAKKTISPNGNEARIYDKKTLASIVGTNTEAMQKLNEISAQRILVLPVSHLGLPNQCKQGIQVYFAFVDDNKELRSRASFMKRTKKSTVSFFRRIQQYMRTG